MTYKQYYDSAKAAAKSFIKVCNLLGVIDRSQNTVCNNKYI